MRKIQWILLLSSSLALQSCGPGTEDATRAKEIEDVNKLRLTYSQFVGHYKGFVDPTNPKIDWYRATDKRRFPTREIPVEMEIRIEEVPDGVNDNREVRFRPEMRGYYQRMDMDPGTFLRVRRPLVITYRPELNQLLMRNSDTIIGGAAGIWNITISGQFSENSLKGDVAYDDRGQGKLNVVREQ